VSPGFRHLARAWAYPAAMSLLTPDSPLHRAAEAGFAPRWLALHEAAAVVGTLAAAGPLVETAESSRFPEAISAFGGWRLSLAEQGLEDLTMILRTGISALLAARERQAPIEAAARALWQEFVAARDGLLALCPAATMRPAA